MKTGSRCLYSEVQDESTETLHPLAKASFYLLILQETCTMQSRSSEEACIAKLRALGAGAYRGNAFVDKYIESTRCVHQLVEKYVGISNANPAKAQVNKLIDLHAALSTRFTQELKKKQQANTRAMLTMDDYIADTPGYNGRFLRNAMPAAPRHTPRNIWNTLPSAPTTRVKGGCEACGGKKMKGGCLFCGKGKGKAQDAKPQNDRKATRSS